MILTFEFNSIMIKENYLPWNVVKEIRFDKLKVVLLLRYFLDSNDDDEKHSNLTVCF